MKTNIILGSIVVFLLSVVGFFAYELFTINQKLTVLGDTSTSTAPLMKVVNTVVRENFTALCLISSNPQICRAAGMKPQEVGPQK